jgi:hypothetical protein
VATTGWLALPTVGTYRITVSVSDPTGATARMWADVTVTAGSGEATITVDLNKWPVVSAFGSTYARIDVGETTPLNASASDPDEDELSYEWSADCEGTFTSEETSTPTFTLDVVPESGLCQLSVTVTDGRGGAANGSLTIAAGPAPVVNVAPQIMSASMAPLVAPSGGTVTLQVQAVDPESGAITFEWASSTGTLGTPVTDAQSSRVVWTAPADFAEVAQITVTIADARQGTTVRTFEVVPRVD